MMQKAATVLKTKLLNKRERLVFVGMLVAALLSTAAAPHFAIAQGTGLTTESLQVIAIVGAVLGGIVRTVIPFLRKRKERDEAIERGDKDENGNPLKPLEFGKSFGATFILGIATSIGAALILLPQTIGQIPSDATVLMALSYAFNFAYTTNDIYNEMAAT
jgi:hypothetical protein